MQKRGQILFEMCATGHSVRAPQPTSVLMSSSRDPKRRRRENWFVVSVLLQITLAGLATYVPSAWRLASLVLYAIVVLLAIVTFVVPAIIGVLRTRKRAT